MSYPPPHSRPDDSYAPDIAYWLYLMEKGNFTGIFVGAILYGIVTILFFQCMGALFDPVNHKRGGINWGLAAHTVAMFFFATIYITMEGFIQSISFTDNRKFVDSVNSVPGPFGYQVSIRFKSIGFATIPVIILNNWLADGLLLYRCYVVYAKDRRIIAFPCLLYVGSLVSGILYMYKYSQLDSTVDSYFPSLPFGASYLSVAVALNLLLTSMVVTRLVLHRKNLRKVMGTGNNTGGLYSDIVTIFVESYSVFAITALLFIGTWGADNGIQYVFLMTVTQTQVIAPLLVTLRIANRRAITSEVNVPGKTSSIYFRSRGIQTFSSENLPCGSSVTSADASGLGVGIGVNDSEDLDDP